MHLNKIRIATRESALALWQANFIAAQIKIIAPDSHIELVSMKTSGDKILDSSLAKIGGKGLFIKELEIALLENRADIAVHSLKDLPAHLDPAFIIGAIYKRDDPRDVFISHRYTDPWQLPTHAKIGTSSLRRLCLFKKICPRTEVVPLRGNIGTRLQKLADGHYDGIILAAAGLARLNINPPHQYFFSAADFLPAVAQGALGVECLATRTDLLALLKPLHHEATAVCIRAERALNTALNGGCQLPIAAYAEWQTDNGLWLRAMVGDATGAMITAEAYTDGTNPEALGQQVADKLLAQGAGVFLAP